MAKKKLIDPAETEIKLSFHNYKLLKKEEFNLKGSCVYFIKGPNETGKSSVLYALRAAHEIKDDTPQKVTQGEVEGVNEFTLPGPDGKIYNIVYEFTDSTTKFVIFDDEGNKISKVTDMRNIFKYNHIDATEFIQSSRTAEGRRKQKELILQLLSSDEYVRYTEIEIAEDVAYNKRTNTNKRISELDHLRGEFELTSEEQKIQANLDRAVELLSKKEKELEKATNSGSELDKLLYKLQDLEKSVEFLKNNLLNIDDKIEQLQIEKRNSIKDLETYIADLKLTQDIYKEFEEKQKTIDTSKEKLKQSVINGRDYVEKAKIYTDKLEKYNKYTDEYMELVESTDTLTTAIEDYRKQKEDIITSGKFPVDNLLFDEEGYLTINGLRFDEKQTCESDTILLVAQLMCKINETPIQIIGDASLLDYKKLDKLYDIAKANGKIMFVDEIDRNLDKLVIVGYEKHDKDKKEKELNEPPIFD